MTSRLSAILSYSMGRTALPPCLRSEIEITRKYVYFEQNRHSFSAEYLIEEGDYLDIPTPRLVLQPLVENAVTHGMDVNGHLTIRVFPVDNASCVVVSDDGCGMDAEKLASFNDEDALLENAGIGLRYIRHMLTQYYEDSSMRFESEAGKGTTVTLILGKLKERGQQP